MAFYSWEKVYFSYVSIFWDNVKYKFEMAFISAHAEKKLKVVVCFFKLGKLIEKMVTK